MYDVYWVDEWDYIADEPVGHGVKLTATPAPSLQVAARAASILGLAAEYHYGPGLIVVLDQQGHRINPYMPNSSIVADVFLGVA